MYICEIVYKSKCACTRSSGCWYEIINSGVHTQLLLKIFIFHPQFSCSLYRNYTGLAYHYNVVLPLSLSLSFIRFQALWTLATMSWNSLCTFSGNLNSCTNPCLYSPPACLVWINCCIVWARADLWLMRWWNLSNIIFWSLTISGRYWVALSTVSC